MAWTTPRTWIAAETVTAAIMNTHVRDNLNLLKTSVNDDGTIAGLPKVARTTADQGITGTTLTNVTGMSFAVGANEVWVFTFRVLFTSAATADGKVGVTFPTSPTAVRYNAYSTQNNAIGGTTTPGAALSFITNGGLDEVLVVEGFVQNSTNSGTVQLQFAQAAASGTTTIYKGTSFFALKTT